MPGPPQWRFRSHLDEYLTCTALIAIISVLMVWEHGWMGTPADQLCLWFGVGVVVGALGFGACYAALPTGDRAVADARRKRRRAMHWLVPFTVLLYWAVAIVNWHRPFGPLYEPALIGFTVAALIGYPWYRQRWCSSRDAYLQAVAAARIETDAAAATAEPERSSAQS